MTKAARSDFKKALAWESLLASARFRKTGDAPTDATAPILMAIWRTARKRLTTVGVDHAVCVIVHKGMRFQVASIYGRDGLLHRFYLRDYFSGVLVLTGDNDGPVFLPQSRDAICPVEPFNTPMSINTVSTHAYSKEI